VVNLWIIKKGMLKNLNSENGLLFNTNRFEEEEMLSKFKNITQLTCIGISLILLASCKTSDAAMITDESGSNTTPVTVASPPVAEPNKPSKVMPMRAISASGYTLEVGDSWQKIASLTPGQENVHSVDRYPGINSNFGGGRVLITAFVNRVNATATSYLDDFLKNQADFTLLESTRTSEGYFLIMNRKGDRNSLRYVKVLFNPKLSQALAYSLNFRVIGNEQSYRASQETDAIAKNILQFFAIT
jgi:hypothetical protein